jgi:hypothetical protein
MIARSARLFLAFGPLLAACTGFSHGTAGATRTVSFPSTWSEQPSRAVVARRERLESASRARESAGGLGQGAAPAAPAVPAAVAVARRPEAGVMPFVAGSPQPAAYAVIVGVERYRDAPPATGATIDADRYAALATRTLGIPESHVRVLRDDRATGNDIDKELAWVASSVPARGRIYFFFSGHGAPDPSTGTSYLVPYDGDPKALEPTALAMPKLLERLSASRAGEVFAVVDACFSGAGGRSVLPAGMRPLVAVREIPPAAKVALFTSASGAQTSGPAPGGDGGLFSKLVAEGIGTGKADIDGDGLVSIQELSAWVTPRVEREARGDRREQVPSLHVGAGLAEAGATPFAFVTAR